MDDVSELNAPAPKPSKPKPRGERVTVIVEPEVMETVRDAVFWTPGETIAGLVERAIMAEIRTMETARGAAFPHRTKSIRMGRPPRDRK
jgi:hypothetical protein